MKNITAKNLICYKFYLDILYISSNFLFSIEFEHKKDFLFEF